MGLLTVGVGQAGGNVVDELLAREPRRGEGVITDAAAVNTAEADLLALERVPERNRVLLGESRVKGHGVGADVELGAEIIRDECNEVTDALRFRGTDGVLVVAGLAGGTGGGAPALADYLWRIADVPVYGLGILPGSDEGGIYTLNASRVLPEFRSATDGLLLFDNDAWRQDDPDPDYDSLNRALVARLRPILDVPSEAGVLDLLDEADGLATIGYASETVDTGDDGLLSRFTGGGETDVDETDATNRLTSLVRKATLGRLTMPAEVADCTHAGLVAVGPGSHLTRSGIERGREWLAEQTDGTAVSHEAVHEGADSVACVVLLAGFRTARRLEDLTAAAEQAEAKIDDLREQSTESLERLVEEESSPGSASGDDPSGVEADGTVTAEDEGTPPSGDDDTGPTASGGTAPVGSGSSGGPDGVDSEPASVDGDTTAAGGTGSDSGAANGSGRRESQPEGAAGADPAGTPTTVPEVPDLSLDYDDIEKIEPIGRGGNADVFRARTSGPDGTVTLALKEPRLDGTLHTEAVERLLTEAETWSKLDDHDHVVDIIDYGSEPLPWIAMEYMDAGHLGERLADESLSFAERRWIAIAITRAVRQAHRRGVAHLDLKPENVLFRSVDDAWDVPKVADWGLSKHLLDHSKSVDGLSPGYAAPEQFDDDCGPSDDRTDISGLGAVIYELFTGRPPFEGSPMEVMRSIVTETPDPPSEVADVPQAVDEALAPALATDRDDRYEDVLRLRDALEALPERD